MKDSPLSQAIHSSLRLMKVPRIRDRRPPGDIPNSLIHVGEQRVKEVTFRIFDYNEEKVVERTSAELEECLKLDSSETPTWIQVCGLHDTEAIGRLLSAFQIHPLIQQDVLNTGHRLKLDDFEDYVFIAVKEIVSENGLGELRHFSMVLTPHAVLTFQEEPSSLFDPVEERIRHAKGQIRKRGADYLAWAILDALVDHFRLTLDHLADEVENLDAAIDRESARQTAERLHSLKQQVDHVFRSVRPLREIAASLQRLEPPLSFPETGIYWSDLRDHTIHATESAEILRETVISLRELHLSVLSQRLNEVMKVLTAFATIFLPLTFLAGIYGMNFRHMPELEWAWGYPTLWLVFITLGGLMFAYFRRKKWI